MRLGMSFRQAARMNTPRGVAHAERIRMMQKATPSSRTKVYEGWALVEWFLDNDRLTEAQALANRLEAQETSA